MNFSKLAIYVFMFFSFQSHTTTAQNIGEGDNNETATIVGGTASARVVGFVSTIFSPLCGGHLIYKDMVVRNRSCGIIQDPNLGLLCLCFY